MYSPHFDTATKTQPLRLAINGFGRIGRMLLRSFLARIDQLTNLQIVAINDVASPQTLLHLLNFDSTHGRLSNMGVSAQLIEQADALPILQLCKADKILNIVLLNQQDPQMLPWQALNIDVVLECTGHFRSYQKASLHKHAGAKQVIIGAAPFDYVDACVVMGVNDDILSKNLPIISGVSCTTQALVPLLYTLDNAFGLNSILMTEVHAITADQMVLDQAHRDLRRARASGHNIIPTTSSSINATLQIMPHLAGKLNGYSIRVPTINVAYLDIDVTFDKKINLAQLKTTLQNAGQTSLKHIMAYTHLPLVSSDFIGDTHSLILDDQYIMQAANQFKLSAWYDNETGYANRLLDMCAKLANCS